MAALAKSWRREWNGIPSRDTETGGGEAAHRPKALNSTAEQRDLLRRNHPFRA